MELDGIGGLDGIGSSSSAAAPLLFVVPFKGSAGFFVPAMRYVA
jgi:hypothetical protein